MLGLQTQIFIDHGAVSEEVVHEMANGVLNLSGADISVAVSGVAGPEGGSEEKPVGTVWLAWAVRHGSKIDTDASLHQFDGDRDAIRELTVAHALQGVLDRLG
jgi:nicotinamide-nucleotide amidase